MPLSISLPINPVFLMAIYVPNYLIPNLIITHLLLP